jgi:hypothetical protein
LGKASAFPFLFFSYALKQSIFIADRIYSIENLSHGELMTLKSIFAAPAKPLSIDYAKEIIRIAEYYLGTHEEGGPNKGEAVEKFQRTVDGKAQGESWCMGFVQYCVTKAATNLGGKPVLYTSESCMTVWAKTPVIHRFTTPEVGRIIIWRHGNGPQGHTGIVTKLIDANTIETIEGNTGGDGKTVEREGDGVYRKQRSLKGSGNMMVMGFIAPFEPMRFQKAVS